MSNQVPRWLNGVFFNEPTENQKKYFAGSMSFITDDESIDKFCDGLKAMAKMYRAIDEKYVRVKITRNDKDAKTEFSFERDDWSKDGAKLDKVKRYLDDGPSEARADKKFNDEDIPF
jgi:hypothetical protein